MNSTRVKSGGKRVGQSRDNFRDRNQIASRCAENFAAKQIRVQFSIAADTAVIRIALEWVEQPDSI
jgi:hypothetical protein